MKSAQLLLLVFSIAACARGPKKTDSVFDSGSLGKMKKAAEAKHFHEESKQIEKILSDARKDRKKLKAESFPLPKPTTEETLYAQLIHSYQSRDLNAVDYYMQEFVSRYPKSVFADNAIYLSGHLKLSLGLPSEALRNFEQVLNKFPMGNKSPAALLEKGIAYRKLNLDSYAQKVFDQVKTKYPGSPEYYKVEIEEKLLSVNAEEKN